MYWSRGRFAISISRWQVWLQITGPPGGFGFFLWLRFRRPRPAPP